MHALAIQVHVHLEILRVGHFVFGDHPWADGAEGVAALTLVPSAAHFELVGAFAHVIDGAIACHIVEGFFLRHIACALANHNAQFNFPI